MTRKYNNITFVKYLKHLLKSSFKSFTLIELLVVLAIIGLFASIVFINIQGARERARIATILQFSATIHHGLGAYAVGIWNFNEGGLDTCPEAKDICDASGENNHGIIFGPTAWISDTPSGGGKALSFSDPANNYVRVDDDDLLDFSLDDSFTISFWMKILENSSQQYLIDKFSSPYGYNIILKSDGKIWWMFHDGVIQRINLTSKKIINDGKWHLITVVRDRETTPSPKGYIYIDGKFDNESNDNSTGSSANNSNFIIGMRGSQYYKGILDELIIYRSALTGAQIQKLYVEGLKKHKLAEK